MNSQSALSILLIPLLTIATAAGFANGGDPANYVGTKVCGMCHKKAETGDQLGVWSKGPHAKAFETLGTEQAKEIATARGIADPQKSGACLSCHATAYHFTDKLATDKVKVEDGVSCESCHGPGKKYLPKSIMEDRAKAIAAGMIYPATQMCTKCHNENSPTFKGFDEKTFSEKIAHPNPAAKK